MKSLNLHAMRRLLFDSHHEINYNKILNLYARFSIVLAIFSFTHLGLIFNLSYLFPVNLSMESNSIPKTRQHEQMFLFKKMIHANTLVFLEENLIKMCGKL